MKSPSARFIEEMDQLLEIAKENRDEYRKVREFLNENCKRLIEKRGYLFAKISEIDANFEHQYTNDWMKETQGLQETTNDLMRFIIAIIKSRGYFTVFGSGETETVSAKIAPMVEKLTRRFENLNADANKYLD
ncbi:aromatic amino acid aminotransferase gamma [Pectobacterium phage POP12]|nr:aromatic amino acid aminotransferase gamma [Pectobacterium phage POP12]